MVICRRRTVVSYAVLVGLCAVVGCSSSTDADVSITGTYTLTAVNAQSLPYRELLTFFESGQTFSDSSVTTTGSLTLNADNTWSASLGGREKIFRGTTVFSDQVTTDSGSGTYTRSGDNLTLNQTQPDPMMLPATVSGSTVKVTLTDTVQVSATQTMIVPHTLTFTKQ